jgi:acetoin utilization deacetylase AcuC-like enzyme
VNRRKFIHQTTCAGLGLAGAVTVSAAKSPAPKRSDQKSPTAFVYDPIYQKHLTGQGHPERPQRLAAVVDSLKKTGLDKRMKRVEPVAGRDEDVLRCHEAEYLKAVKRDIAAGADRLSTGDTNICPDSLEVALKAVGGVLAATDQVCTGKAANAFCAVRPPGHHATDKRGMGFCIFNNVAIAARYAQKKHKIGKVLIVDWDVHHGNGTQDIFYEDDSVFFLSTHQSPWYPGTGAKNETGTGKGLGATMNFPLPAGAGRKQVLGAFTDKLVPAMREFKPELVLISAGFDSRRDDPLGRFTLDDDDFADLTQVAMDIADEHAGGRIVSVLEGGYRLEGLASATAAHVKTLIESKKQP